MVRCDRCRVSDDTICPCYVTVLYVLNRSGADTHGIIRQSSMVIPATLTLYLCQSCNRNHADLQLGGGPLSAEKMREWLNSMNKTQAEDVPS
jgi:hypothetical protein